MDILKLVVGYLTLRHPELNVLLPGSKTFVFQQGGKRLEGYSRATFFAGKWEISIGHAVIPKTVYNVTADYNHGEIVWSGQVINDHLEENTYVKISQP